ncbi:acetylxylan esterase [Salipaludibacillus sp. CUR1]|uniref:alpha/beta fold hydrolase n=1 Tax=Salipaludibacillus sp. CUR1 TaxID=2820003 RepID=UPI001E5930F1|nr:alpha/beta fold hydrolase [Salipaludibacillus sp. CUR1]MCE7793163.1 acetylxylan esterase [Salipaludibacillus sp. CUR1]
MPMIDMPINELKNYQGTNPRPVDFNEYWDRALKEMNTVDPKIELMPSTFQVGIADCYDMYFTGVRGARIHVKVLMPKSGQAPYPNSTRDNGSTADTGSSSEEAAENADHPPKQNPAILMFHGYSMNAGDWSDKLHYAALGYTVFAMDVRGQGGQSEDVGGVKGNTLQGHVTRGLDDHADNLFYRQVFLDTAQLAKIVMNRPDINENEVMATGWSQGGGLALVCAALEPRIKKAAAVYPFLSDYKRVWKLDLAVDAYQDLRRYFRRFDPQHKRRHEVFTKLGYIDIQHLASRIKAEFLMGVGLMDEICPPSSQFAAYNKITSPKRLELFPDFEHENLPGLDDIILQYFLEK